MLMLWLFAGGVRGASCFTPSMSVSMAVFADDDMNLRRMIFRGRRRAQGW